MPRASAISQQLQLNSSPTNIRIINISPELPALQECFQMNYCGIFGTSEATMFIKFVNRKQYCDIVSGMGPRGHYCPVSLNSNL